ncbi:MAG TPA: tRNA lysidine(34) synthetase TilS [Burkholderiaceae bacterium]|nr:tRNA lysidine(34) synthetase TilS [Burkholderiaceae bacterium]
MAVAWSGGRDSTALMHATARCAQALAHEGFALRVLGLHVHHGLSPQADDWLAQLQRQTQVWAAQGLPVELRWHRLSGAPGPGDSIEAWAREGRHAALQAMAEDAGASLLLLAHHRRDQAETWLLQALRGAGLAGLSAMPRRQAREGLVWARPWLDQPRERIEAYVQAQGLAHVEDESNADPRFARNRLRLRLWPVLEAGFPAAESALAQSARWAQEADALLDEIAEQDLRVWMKAPAGLDLKAWEALSRPRLSNLLRHWLRDRLGRAAPASLVGRLLDEVGAAAPGAAWPAGEQLIQKHRGALLALAAPRPVPVLSMDCRMDLSQPGLHACPAWRGRWRVDTVDEPSSEAVGSSLLCNVILRPREGSEQFQRASGTPPRSLKKSWQAAGVPAPERGGPLVFVDFPGETRAEPHLLWVPALGLDARWQGRGEGPWRRLSWLPDAP